VARRVTGESRTPIRNERRSGKVIGLSLLLERAFYFDANGANLL
jgi:hypothetical protein